MKGLMQQLMRIVLVAGIILMILGALDPNLNVVTFRVGVAILILAFPYGLLGGKDAGFPVAVGFALMFEAILANEIQTPLLIAIGVGAVLAIIWIIRQRQQNLRQPHTRRRPPGNWQRDETTE